MRHVALSVVVVLALLGCATHHGSDKQRSEIEQARSAFWEAHARGDARALAALVTEDAILMAPGMPDIRGRSAIQNTAQQMFTALSITDFKIERSEIQVIGDTAYEVTSYSETLHPTSGTPGAVQGRYLIVWKRGQDTVWRVHRNLFNMASGSHP
ncbi:MAG TPA: SgcJ/EcaC family oxidoreductase [Thermoanaerobaculia bacterium]|jgi:uncharacterized protein (TIGR02246 family)